MTRLRLQHLSEERRGDQSFVLSLQPHPLSEHFPAACGCEEHGVCSISGVAVSMCFLFLARKTNKQVFVSYNLQNTDSNFALLVENRIKEEMEAFPEKF